MSSWGIGGNTLLGVCNHWQLYLFGWVPDNILIREVTQGLTNWQKRNPPRVNNMSALVSPRLNFLFLPSSPFFFSLFTILLLGQPSLQAEGNKQNLDFSDQHVNYRVTTRLNWQHWICEYIIHGRPLKQGFHFMLSDSLQKRLFRPCGCGDVEPERSWKSYWLFWQNFWRIQRR